MQTTQLADEVEKISSSGKMILSGDEVLTGKIKDLEHKICSWDYNDTVGMLPVHRPQRSNSRIISYKQYTQLL
jgi:hypothetical protein